MSTSTAEAKAAPNRPGWGLHMLVNLIERGAVPLGLLILVIIFSVNPSTGPVFRSAANIQNIIGNQSVVGMVALAMVIPMASGYFDLSTAAVAAASNVVCAEFFALLHAPIPVAIIAGVVIGALCGVANGLLVAGLGLNPFITTLGSYILITGLLQWQTGGQLYGTGIPNSFVQWGNGKFLGLANPFWILIVIAAICWYVMTQVPYGRRLAAIGSNESAARLAGIRVNRIILEAFVISGAIAGAAGVMLTLRAGNGAAATAPTYLFPALAAVFLGQTSIRPGFFNVWGTIFAVFLIAVATTGFTLMGASLWIANVFDGAVLIVAIFISTMMARVRDRRARAVQLSRLEASDAASSAVGDSVPAA